MRICLCKKRILKIQDFLARQVPVCRTRFQQGLGQARPNKNTSKRGSVAEVQSRKGTTFSRIENLWPRDDSCSPLFRCVS